MIVNSTDEAGLQAKQEEKNEERVNPRAVPSNSRQWSSFRNPRIVRVSRSFGGKDRHSKVCTVRGLRDRRIRLSVPTAVQLYDLQDKLGLSQPSKVVDWLLDATKQDIDKLPPLQMPPGFDYPFHTQMFGDAIGSRNIGDLLLPHESSASHFSLSPFFPTSSTSLFLAGKSGIEINDNVRVSGETALDLGLRAKDKEILFRNQSLANEKGKSIETNELQKNDEGIEGQYAQRSAQNFFPIVGYSSLPSGLTNSSTPYSYSNQWEISNLSLSQFGGLQPQPENFSGSAAMPSSSSALPSGSQLYFCPPTMPSLFPTYPPYFATATENNIDPRQNHSLMPSLHLINPQLKSFQTNTANAKFLHSQDDTGSEDDDQAAN